MKSKIISVRIGEKTALELASISLKSDRTISQLCRYALAYLDLDAQTIINKIPDTKLEDFADEATGFRLNEEDARRVLDLAKETESNASDIIRVALRNWLENGKPQKDLGTPPRRVKIGGK